MIGLVDCNNFYASCERVFQPHLIGRPVVILSNNDGCVIARSNEAKALGIKMGDAAFLMQEVFEKNKIEVFSSNYALYGDMSARVMEVLGRFTPEIEVYSIDESFLDLSNMAFTNLEDYSREIRDTVRQYTGIPTGIGVAATKSLAKAANKYAKKVHPSDAVFIIDSEEKRKQVLQWLPLEDVWGIGHRHLSRLQYYGMKTAWDLAGADLEFIRNGDKKTFFSGRQYFKGMGVVGVRLVQELNGTRCYDLETQPEPKQNICTSRSFPRMLTDKEEIAQAVGTYVTRCAEKLRDQESCCAMISVFLMTNGFSNDPQYSAHLPIKLKVPSSSTRELIHFAMQAFNIIYKPGFNYKKAGVIVSEIVPQDQVQTSLFDKAERGPESRDSKLMKAMDIINKKMGQDKVRFGAAGYGRSWRLKRERLSKCYTTNPLELLTIHI